LKVTIYEQPNTETELIIRCSHRTQQEVQELLDLIDNNVNQMPLQKNDGFALIRPEKILYCEFVNRTVFAYTADEVFSTGFTLAQLEQRYPSLFRCSKSAVVNVRQISLLKSELNGRILATLSNGEQILISRHYASSLRKLLNEK